MIVLAECAQVRLFGTRAKRRLGMALFLSESFEMGGVTPAAKAATHCAEEPSAVTRTEDSRVR